MATRNPTQKIKFTIVALEKLPVTGVEYIVRSAEHKGLRCRVYATGAKVIEVVRKPTGKPNQVRVKIGELDGLTIKAIEKKYTKINTELQDGKNPNAERKAEKETAEATNVTLSAAFKRFKANSDLAPATLTAYTNAVENHLKTWKNEPLSAITGATVRAKHKEISKTGKIAANNAMRAFRAIYNYMYDELEDENENPILPPCPTRKLTTKGKRVGWNKETRKQGQVEPEDLKTWWKATNKIASTITAASGKQVQFYKGGDGELARDYLQFVILTGLRRREASGLQWKNINLKSKTFTVTETKSGKPLKLPLSDYLVDMLTRRKKLKECKAGPFPINEVKRFVSKVREISGLEFTVHDLRRSFIGYASDCNLGVLTIKALVNHSVENKSGDVTEGYLISTHRRLRKPMEQITAFVLRHAGVIDSAPVELMAVK